MAELVRLTIDGEVIGVPAGSRLFDACRQVRGQELPHFCYHPDLSVAGVCRLCQVEIEGQPQLVIACNTLVCEGMVVHTRTARVMRAVRQILEMHLINHPVDCPICDQAGECALQDQYMDFGLYESEVAKQDKIHKSKAKIIGPHVILDQERCVLCGRCVRFCDEVTGTSELGIFNRGDRAVVDVAPGVGFDNGYTLNTADICPVGALTSRDFRFKKRVWLLRSTSSVCPGCGTGCNVRIDHEAGRVYRLLPRRNDEVNGPWLCDQGRMLYKNLHVDNRLSEPLERRDGRLSGIPWREAVERLQVLCQRGGVAFALADCGQSLEELVLFQRLARLIAGQGQMAGGLAGEARAEGDALLLDADRWPNRRTLDWLGFPEVEAGALATQLSGSRGVLLLYGGDPMSLPALSAAAGTLRIAYLGTHRNATAEGADLVIPMSAWAEKDALWVNRQGRIQRGRRAIAAPGTAREDWRLLAELLTRLGDTFQPADLTALRRLVAGELGMAEEDLLNRLPAAGLMHEPSNGPNDAATGGS